MFVRARHFQTLRLLSLALATATALSGPLAAQAPAPPPVAPAQFDPQEVYFQAYLARTDAEKAEKDQNYVAALDKFQQSEKLLKAVTTYYPKWKTEMVTDRAAKTAEAVNRIRPLADAQREKERGVIAELEGGVRKPVRPGGPDAAVIEEPNPLRINPLDQRRLNDEQANIDRIRRDLQAAMTPPAQVARQEERIKQLEDQLRAAEISEAKLRAQLARAPMEGEVKTLNQRIARLEQERDAMSMALTQSRKEHIETLAKADRLEADLKVIRQQAADLQRDLDLQRTTSNETMAGMRRQLRSLQTSLADKDKQLAAAHNQINGLKRELQQSQEAAAQLRTERDNLAAERDQMRALLSLNEAGRIQELIDQNMGLRKDLREKEAKLDALHRDNNATKDELAEAINDIAVAKGQINRLKQDRRIQEQQLADLQARLKREDRALETGQTSASQAEVATLRNIIKRQLLIQERIRQQAKILFNAARELGKKDEKIRGAMEILDGAELPLTPEEKQLVEGNADAEIFSPFVLDPDRAAHNSSAQARDLASYDRAATKAFASGRFLSARELFELSLAANPGHVTSLCKLGVVHLRLDEHGPAADAFRRAAELDPSNPYAHRMLGFALFNLGDLPGAEQSVRRSVELAQDDAKSQNLLARIYYLLGRPKDAETHFKAAISADPVSSEPYFNLAVVCANAKRLKDARGYYQQALERGAVPDPKLQETLDAP